MNGKWLSEVLLGGSVAGIADLAMDKARILVTELHPKLPVLNDWILLGSSLAVTLIGCTDAIPCDVRNFGVGMLAYAIPMFIYRLVERNVTCNVMVSPEELEKTESSTESTGTAGTAYTRVVFV